MRLIENIIHAVLQDAWNQRKSLRLQSGASVYERITDALSESTGRPDATLARAFFRNGVPLADRAREVPALDGHDTARVSAFHAAADSRATTERAQKERLVAEDVTFATSLAVHRVYPVGVCTSGKIAAGTARGSVDVPAAGTQGEGRDACVGNLAPDARRGGEASDAAPLLQRKTES